MKIVGFVILKKAPFNYYRFAGIELPKVLRVNNLYYQGIGRLVEDQLLESAPHNLQDIVERAIDNYSECLMYSIFLRLDEVSCVLNNLKESEHLEIIAVHSEKLAAVFGEKDYLENEFEFIGVDVDVDGVYPIKEELFASNMIGDLAKGFQNSVQKLNKFGIFDSIEDASEYLDSYLAIQDEANLEMIEKNQVEWISLYRFL